MTGGEEEEEEEEVVVVASPENRERIEFYLFECECEGVYLFLSAIIFLSRIKETHTLDIAVHTVLKRSAFSH